MAKEKKQKKMEVVRGDQVASAIECGTFRIEGINRTYGTTQSVKFNGDMGKPKILLSISGLWTSAADRPGCVLTLEEPKASGFTVRASVPHPETGDDVYFVDVSWIAFGA